MKPRENLSPKYFKISDDETDFTIGIVSFIYLPLEYHRIPRKSKFHIFRGNRGSAGHLAHFECLTVCHVLGAE